MIFRRFPLRLIYLFVVVIALTRLTSAFAGADGTANAAPILTTQRILVLGDSITQDGRYVTFLEYYLHQIVPNEKTDIISIGLSSETASGLSEKSHPFPRPCVVERLDRALKTVKPKLVLACYGMNDGIYHPLAAERLAAFEAGIHELINQVRATGAQLILLTPPVFDTVPIKARTVPAEADEFSYSKPFAGYDEVLAEFSRFELALSEPGVTVIDLHGPLTTALLAQRTRNPAFTFSPDGIHPNDAGHLLITRVILESLGYSLAHQLNDPATIQADPRFPLIRDRRQLRSEAWLPFVGYIRGDHFKSATVDAAETAAARLQREIDASSVK